MIEGIDHIGVFVADLNQSLHAFCKAYDVAEPPVVDVPERRKKYAVLKFGDCSLELLEDYDPDSPFNQRVCKEGSFIHHFALRATDIRNDISFLEEQGCEKIGLEPKPGLRGPLIQFIKDKALALEIEITQL